MNNVITEIFESLSRWRHYPAYQLERRADIFFAIYVPGFICSKFSGCDNVNLQGRPALIPEFPVRLDIATGAETASNASKNVDYVVPLKRTSGETTAVFVEFKTDDLSAGDEQLKMMTHLKTVPLEKCLGALPSIVNATTHWRKYYHLLRDLEDCGLIRGAKGELRPFVPQDAKQQGRTEVVNAISPIGAGVIESVYLVPNGGELKEKAELPVYTFSDFGEYLRGLLDDEFAVCLADNIERWAAVKAGDVPEEMIPNE